MNKKKVEKENSFEERERLKLLDQINLDRDEMKNKVAKTSVTTKLASPFGSNFLNSLKDIGVDVNKGG